MMPPKHLTKFRLNGARLSVVAACVLLAALSLSKTLTPAGSAESRPEPERRGESARLSEGYGKLPLRFEANRGQTSGRVKFLARGSGYTLFLAETGAVLRLRAAGPGGGEGARASGTLRLTLEGANRRPLISGQGELPGRSNYLVGRDARAWRTGVPAFEKVRYESVYKGIDALYYGRQGQLEYDFVVAPGADPGRIRLRFDGARGTRVDDNGDLVITAEGGDVRQQRPFAYQEFDGARREVAARYVLDARGRVSFELGEYDRARSLVIDPVLFYSSYLGGASADQGAAVAVDSAGSAYVAGTTASTDFPGSGSFQASKGDFNDAFILKLSPDGKSLVYATYLGGNGDESASSVAVDAAGHAYVAGFTASGGFPVTAGSFQTSKDALGDAFLAKLNPAGTGLVYSTFIGGNGSEQVNSVAVDAAGAAYVAGRTDSFNFSRLPVVNRAGNPAHRSTDGGASWASSSTGLTASIVNDFAVAPGAPNVVYAASNLGVYSSTDGGASWQLAGRARTSTAPPFARTVVVDPSDTSIVYVGTNGGFGIYKSTDGGSLFEGKSSGLPIPLVNSLAINPAAPATLYAGTALGIFKTTNGGDSWAEVRGGLTGASPNVNKIVVDPSNPQTVYAATTTRGVLKSTNGGANWAPFNNGLSIFGSSPQIRSLAFDPANSSTLYVGVSGFATGVYKSTDGGANWTSSSTGLTVTFNGQSGTPPVTAVLVDPAATSTIYAGTSGYGVFKSTDGGASWAPTNAGLANRNINALASRPGSPAAILAGASAGSDPFLMKFNPEGSAPEYLRMLGGSEFDEARGVATGPDGSAFVTGMTASADFPAVNAQQPALAGSAVNDAFVVKVDPGGNTVYSTYLGGTSSDQGVGIAVGPDGGAYVAGGTFSNDFPAVNPLKSTFGPDDFQDAFVTRLSPDGQTLVYSTYLGGTSGDQAFGVAVGSDGSAHVVGQTTSPNFPLAGVGNPLAGISDAFVTRLSPDGSALLFSTCFGGMDQEQANGVALDGAGGIYLVGNTLSTNLPLSHAARGTHGGGGTDAFIAKFGPGIDLAVTMTDSPDPVALGADLTYSVRVRNNGDLPATGVVLTDALPEGATLVSAAADRGSCSGAATVVCDIGTLAGGEGANVTVKVKPPATRTISNTAAVTLNEADASANNNSATTQTTVDFADLAVTKSALIGKVRPGSKAVFLLGVTNKSGAAAGPVTINDVLPAGLTFVSCDAPGGTCGGEGNGRTVTFPSLAAGATRSATIVATVEASAADGTVIGNTATASSALPDPDTSDNSASASVTAGPVAPPARSNGKIVFIGPDGIYTVNPDGTGRTRILEQTPSWSLYFPVWSPDGTRLSFLRYVPGAGFPTAYEFYTVNADGSNLRKIANTSVESRATWSPDGTHLAYINHDGGGEFSLHAVRPDGTGDTRLAPLPGLAPGPGLLHGPDWSPDGTRFAIDRDYNNIYVLDVDGSNQRKVTTTVQTSDGPTRDTHPFWTPDGSRITFTRSTINGFDSYVVNADGTGLSLLLNIRQIARGQVSPDGTKVLYVRFDSMSVANGDGSGLPVSLGGGTHPGWQSLPNANPTPTPTPVETFDISGRITKADGSAGGAGVKLSGTRTATTGTDGNGNYTFVNLPKGGTYTVTPVRETFGLFTVYTPGSRTVSDLQADTTGLDFTQQTNLQHVVRGRVTDAAGNGLGGARVVITRGGQIETTTDAQGNYSFTIVLGGDLHTMQAFLSGFAFEPFRVQMRPTSPNVTVNFVGAPQAGVSALQGRIIDTSGNPVADRPVVLSGGRNAVVRTNSGGGFFFNNLPAEQSYTVTPSTADGLGFTPAQRTYANLSGSGPVEPFIATSALPSVQFAATDVSVDESARFVELTLTRGPDPQLTAYVDFETSDLNGSERADYIAAHGRVRFAPGETSRKLRVLITDDNFVEGERTFKVTLKGARNALVGGANEAVVRIAEDDASESAANPLDSSQFFVAQHYADFLNRAPDDEGLAFWTNGIERCGADAGCREAQRVNVSAAFFLSIEFQETGFLVYRTHKAAFGTGEALPHKTFLKDSHIVGGGVVVGQGDWSALLDANKQAYLEEFVLRPEFQLVYPQTLAPSVFVDMLNANAGGSLAPGERDALVAGLTSGALTRAAVLRAVAESAEFSRRETNRAFVLTQYYGYLRRAPNDPPDSDFAGYNFWLGKLNEFNGNYIAAEMVKAFISSDEYRRRFGRQ